MFFAKKIKTALKDNFKRREFRGTTLFRLCGFGKRRNATVALDSSLFAANAPFYFFVRGAFYFTHCPVFKRRATEGYL